VDYIRERTYESEQNASALAGTHEIDKISDPDEDVKNILAIGWARRRFPLVPHEDVSTS
jgi:hypothetical protein